MRGGDSCTEMTITFTLLGKFLKVPICCLFLWSVRVSIKLLNKRVLLKLCFRKSVTPVRLFSASPEFLTQPLITAIMKFNATAPKFCSFYPLESSGLMHKRPGYGPFFAENPFSPANEFVLMGLVVRKCHFDVTACAEARRLAP